MPGKFSRTIRVLAFCLLPFAFCLSSCVRKGGRIAQANHEQVLFLGNGADPAGLDPQTVIGEPESHIFNALFEGLVSMDPKDLHPIPGVAESWDITDGGRTYTFHLRHDARWSNGDALTSRDFLDSYHRILQPGLGAQYATMFFDDVQVVNAREYYEGQIKDFAQVGFAAPDPYTFVIRLKTPASYFLGMLNHNSWYPVHLPTVLKFGREDQPSTRWTSVGNFVGNGPFRLKAWTIEKEVIVEKSPTYWGAKDVRLREIHYLNTEDADAEERAFRAGQLHATYELPLSKIDVYRQRAPQLLQIAPYFGVYFYRFNVNHPSVQDRRVRRALAMAIDRDGIVKNVTRGGQEPAHVYVPPNPSGYRCQSPVPTDYEGARRLLAEAGYPGGQGLPPVELLINTSEAHRAVAEAIQRTWHEQLGVDARIRNEEWKVYLASQNDHNFCTARGGWIGDYFDPFAFLSIFVSNNGLNWSAYNNPEYDRLVAAAHGAASDAERLALFQQAETILLEDAPVAPIYDYTRVYLLQPSVKGWYNNMQDRHMPQFIYLDENAPVEFNKGPLADTGSRP